MAASRLFHQMAYLGTGFAKRLKGPDLHQNKDRSRIREIWEYRRTPQVDAALIDHTTHGVTIAEACRTMASQTLRRERRCEVAAQTAVDCFLMGIAFTPQDIAVMEEILVQEKDLERAREILRKYHVPAAAVGKRRLEDDGSKGSKKGINLRAVISWLIVAAVLLAILWPVIQSRL